MIPLLELATAKPIRTLARIPIYFAANAISTITLIMYNAEIPMQTIGNFRPILALVAQSNPRMPNIPATTLNPKSIKSDCVRANVDNPEALVPTMIKTPLAMANLFGLSSGV